MNSVILIGRLARDPELSFTPNTNKAVCKFTIAVDRMKKEDGADFIRITVWGKQAENCDRFLRKGRQVAVMGRIQTGSYKKNDETIYTTDVVADRVEFLGSSQNEEKRELTYDARAEQEVDEPREKYTYMDDFMSYMEDKPF